MSNTRNFTVNGTILSRFMPPSGVLTETVQGIEVQLWHQAPMESIYLGTGFTNSEGEFDIVFQVESPVSYIVDGEIRDVFIKTLFNGELIESFEYDSDAQLYFNQLSPQPSAAFKVAINKLVLDLKATGNWQKFDRLWIHATEQQQHAKISLIHPTTTAITEVSSPSWTNGQGYAGNGTTSYLNTNYNPFEVAGKFRTNDGSMFYYSRTNLAQNSVDMGNGNVTSGDNGSAMAPKLASNQTQVRIQASVNVNGLDFTDTSGLLYVNRSQSDITTYGRNGLQFASIVQPQTGIANANFYICGASWGTVLKFPSTRQIALSGVGSGSVDQYALYLAVQEFATTLGFQV